MSAFSSVDLPEPEGPTTASMLDGSSANPTSSRMRRPRPTVTTRSTAPNQAVLPGRR